MSLPIFPKCYSSVVTSQLLAAKDNATKLSKKSVCYRCKATLFQVLLHLSGFYWSLKHFNNKSILWASAESPHAFILKIQSVVTLFWRLLDQLTSVKNLIHFDCYGQHLVCGVARKKCRYQKGNIHCNLIWQIFQTFWCPHSSVPPACRVQVLALQLPSQVSFKNGKRPKVSSKSKHWKNMLPESLPVIKNPEFKLAK